MLTRVSNLISVCFYLLKKGKIIYHIFFFAKRRLCSACVGIIMIGESETWPVKEDNVIRFGRNYARMVRWMFSDKPEDIIIIVKLRKTN